MHVQAMSTTDALVAPHHDLAMLRCEWCGRRAAARPTLVGERAGQRDTLFLCEGCAQDFEPLWFDGPSPAQTRTLLTLMHFGRVSRSYFVSCSGEMLVEYMPKDGDVLDLAVVEILRTGVSSSVSD